MVAYLLPEDQELFESLESAGIMARSAIMDELRMRVDLHRQEDSRLEMYGEPSVSGVFADGADALEWVIRNVE